GRSGHWYCSRYQTLPTPSSGDDLENTEVTAKIIDRGLNELMASKKPLKANVNQLVLVRLLFGIV
ncbi:hypothetical protein QHH11_27600, partial [Aphanizomenon sp. PH219]|nr:hypothetical protein [Aphanizomenon sp. PH219]